MAALEDRFEFAKDNAKQSLRLQEADGSRHENPSTNVYELLDLIVGDGCA